METFWSLPAERRVRMIFGRSPFAMGCWKRGVVFELWNGSVVAVETRTISGCSSGGEQCWMQWGRQTAWAWQQAQSAELCSKYADSRRSAALPGLKREDIVTHVAIERERHGPLHVIPPHRSEDRVAALGKPVKPEGSVFPQQGGLRIKCAVRRDRDSHSRRNRLAIAEHDLAAQV